MNKKEVRSILIIGIRGGLAKLTAQLLQKQFPEAKIVGIDSREINNLPTPLDTITSFSMKYTRGSFENLFRNNAFDLVYHIGRVIDPESQYQYNISKMLDIGLMETRRFLDLCASFSVKKVIILSTYHVYGAHPDNPVHIKEDSPLRASLSYPPLLNVVEVDQIASSWMWQNQNQVSTVIFRPCNIIGPQIQNTITRYLTSKYSPIPIDYNPMFQFVHEFDMAQTLAYASTHVPTGIYNVAPEDFLSIRQSLKVAGAKGVPTPMVLLGKVASLARKVAKDLPDYLIDYLKYSCLIDGSKLQKQLPKKFFHFSTEEALKFLR